MLITILGLGCDPVSNTENSNEVDKGSKKLDQQYQVFLFFIERVFTETAFDFKAKYRDSLESLLLARNSSINTSLPIKSGLLSNMLGDQNSGYLKIKIVQIPQNINESYNYLSPYRSKIYLLFALADANKVQQGTYKAIDNNLSTVQEINHTDTLAFINEFMNGYYSDFRTIHPQNTHTLFVNISLLKQYLDLNTINQNQQVFSYINLNFCQVTKYARRLSEIPGQSNKANSYHNQFSLLWESFDVNHRRIQGVETYDMNDLCPPTCPF